MLFGRLGGSTTADDFSAHPNHRPSEVVRPVSSWTPYASPEQLVAPMTSTSQASFLGTFGRPSTAIVPSSAIVPPSGDGCLPLRTRNQEMSDWVANQPPPTAAIQPRDALGLGGSFEDETEVAASFRPHPVMVAQPYEAQSVSDIVDPYSAPLADPTLSPTGRFASGGRAFPPHAGCALTEARRWLPRSGIADCGKRRAGLHRTRRCCEVRTHTPAALARCSLHTRADCILSGACIRLVSWAAFA